MGQLIDVRLPHMGVVERATLTAWHKGVGDNVAEGEALCDVSTDKVDTEVASPVSGRVVRLVAAVDEELPVGSLIAQFADAAASDQEINELASTAKASSASSPTAPAPAPKAAPAEESTRPGIPILSSPLARRLAKEARLDLSTVVGTGAGGRIRRMDVASAIARQTAREARPALPAADVPMAPSMESGAGRPPSGYEDVPYDAVVHTPTRRAIAEHMIRSVSTAPQLTAQVDVDMSGVSRIRGSVNAERERTRRPKLSFLAFIARATVSALNAHPTLNATWTETHLLQWRTVNLGIAVDADQGLVVPVVQGAERLSTEGLAVAIAELSTKTRSRQLDPIDVRGGTFTISNSGSVGGVIATPILNQPQVAALGVPAIIRQPVAVVSPEGEEYIAIRPVMRLGLTFDHRAVDGAAALRALLTIQEHLETWPREAYE